MRGLKLALPGIVWLLACAPPDHECGAEGTKARTLEYSLDEQRPECSCEAYCRGAEEWCSQYSYCEYLERTDAGCTDIASSHAGCCRLYVEWELPRLCSYR